MNDLGDDITPETPPGLEVTVKPLERTGTSSLGTDPLTSELTPPQAEPASAQIGPKPDVPPLQEHMSGGWVDTLFGKLSHRVEGMVSDIFGQTDHLVDLAVRKYHDWKKGAFKGIST